MSVWIESHQALEKSHKLFDLMAQMHWSKAEAIGHLHLFWWWSVDQAEDGDLRKFQPTHLALAADIPLEHADAFVAALVQAGFLEYEPYFRIRNWWQYLGRFLKVRYGKRREKWQAIERLYTTQGQPDGNPMASTPVGGSAAIPATTTAGEITTPHHTTPKEKEKEAGGPPSFLQVARFGFKQRSRIPVRFSAWWYSMRCDQWGWTNRAGNPVDWQDALKRQWSAKKPTWKNLKARPGRQQNERPGKAFATTRKNGF